MLAAGAEAEAAAAAAARGLPPARVELLGAGVMEWRASTGRALLLAPPDAPLCGDLRGAAPPRDVSALAASLVRSALPCHYAIHVLGDAAAGGGGSP
jgi:hypothetical protein